jgi:hypothetical protein
VVKPIPGLTNTSSISVGRITKVAGLIWEKTGLKNDTRIVATVQNRLTIILNLVTTGKENLSLFSICFLFIKNEFQNCEKFIVFLSNQNPGSSIQLCDKQRRL